MAGLEECDAESPELGLSMKESAHGHGFGLRSRHLRTLRIHVNRV
jgi:hypothetical protein